MEKKIKTYKGFNSDMTCRGFQYEVGKTYEHDGDISLCESGFHAISDEKPPLSLFDFYSPSLNGKLSRYCEVEAGGDIEDDGKKVCCNRLTVVEEIGITGVIKAHVEWVKKRITNENNAEPGKEATAGEYGVATAGHRGVVTAGEYGVATAGHGGAATAGEYGAATAGHRGAATAGNRGAATAGDSGAATAGDRGAATAGEYGVATAGEYGVATAGDSGAATAGDSGAATAGEYGVATAGHGGAATAGKYGAAISRGSAAVGENGVAVVRGNNIKVRGGLGSLLVIAIENVNDYNIKEWRAVVVDGDSVKPDTWYKLEEGQFVEYR